METRSLHQHIVAEIEARILSGAWPPGHRIPAEAALLSHFACSRMTVNKALTQLARAGLVERKRKVGTFVLRPSARPAVLEIQNIRHEVEAMGARHSFQIVRRREKKAVQTDVGGLAVPIGTPLLVVHTLHLADDRPFCFEVRTINLAVVPHAASETFADEPPGSWLVHHVPWTDAEHRIRAAEAAPLVCTQLGLATGAASLVIERRTWLRGQPVTHVLLNYPATAHELVARFSPGSDDGA